MNKYSKRIIHFLCLLCVCILCFDLTISMTKVNTLIKTEKESREILKLENEKIIYVSTTGNDSNSGLSESQAKKTIQAAIDLAQSSINSQNVTIKIGKGHHFVSEPISITQAATSGSIEYTLKIEGNENGASTIDGGTKIESEWALENETNPYIWVTNIGTNKTISGFYVDGDNKRLAGTDLEEVTPSLNGLSYASARLKIDNDIIRQEIRKLKLIIEWKDCKNLVSLYSAGKNSDGSSTIYYTDESWKAMSSVKKSYTDGVVKYRIINSKKFLDEEGEYFYDSSTGKLYYYSNANPNQSLCVIPISNGLLNIQGTTSKLASNIEISNLNFKYGTDNNNLNVFWTDKYDVGYTSKSTTEAQFAPRKAQINIGLASNITIDSCSIEDCTTNGINIENNVYNLQIYNNFFENLGGSAVKVGKIYEKTEAERTGDNLSFSEKDSRAFPTNLLKVYSVNSNTNCMPAKISIINNLIEGVGKEYYSTPGILVNVARVVDIKNNTISNAAGSGIAAGYSTYNSLNNNITTKSGSINIENNKIEAAVNKLSYGAPILISGSLKNGGFLVKNNYISRENVQSNNTEFGKWGGILVEQGSDNGEISYNVVNGFKNWINERAIYYDNSNNPELVKEMVLRNIQIEHNYANTSLENYSFTPQTNLEQPKVKSFDSTRNNYNSNGSVSSTRTSGEPNGMISAQNVKNTPYFTNLSVTNPNVTYDYSTNKVSQTTWNTEATNIINNSGSTLVRQSDMEGPVITVTQDTQSTWTQENITIQINVIDDSGVDKASIAREEDSWSEQLTLDSNGNCQVSLDKSGIYKIIAIDMEGNSRTEVVTITNIDKEAPTIRVNETITKTSEIEINAEITDDISGVNITEYRLVKSRTNPTPLDGSSWQNDNIITGLLENKTYYIQIRAIDNAGNEGSIIIEAKTKKMPSMQGNITITPSTREWTKEDVILELEVDNSDLTIELSTNGTTFRNIGTAKSVKVEKNQKVYFRFTDGINRSDMIYYEVTNIDKTAPLVNYSEKYGNKRKIRFVPNIIDKNGSTINDEIIYGVGVKESKFVITKKSLELVQEEIKDDSGNVIRIDAYEKEVYKPVNGFSWQDTPIFDGLEEATEYYVWCHTEDLLGNARDDYTRAHTSIEEAMKDMNDDSYKPEYPKPTTSPSTSPSVSPSPSQSPTPSTTPSNSTSPSTSPSTKPSTSPSPTQSTSPSPTQSTNPSTSPTPTHSSNPSPSNTTPEQLKTIITSDRYNVKTAERIIRVDGENNISTFKNNIKVNKEYEIENNLGNTTTNGNIKTGYRVKTEDDLYYIVIVGDIGGNGTIDIIDLAKLRQHILGVSGRTITGLFAEAADINGNGTIDIIDLARLRRIILEM